MRQKTRYREKAVKERISKPGEFTDWLNQQDNIIVDLSENRLLKLIKSQLLLGKDVCKKFGLTFREKETILSRNFII